MDLLESTSRAVGHDAEELLGGDSSAVLHRHALAEARQRRLFDALHTAVPWQQHRVTVFGRTHRQPRLVAWYADAGRTYTYSGLTLIPNPWIVPILELKALCQELSGAGFNSVLLNLYRDGDDTVGWHSDDEPAFGREPVIASVSLGAARRFDLRHKRSRRIVRIELPPGSVLVMSGRCQAEWSHRVPRTRRVGEPRINLTFRRIVQEPAPTRAAPPRAR